MAPPPRLKAIPFGERGLLVELAGGPATLAAVARAVAAADPALDVGVGSASMAIVDAAPMAPLRRAEVQGLVARCLLAERGARRAAPAEHRVGVVYDGPDLAEVASSAGLTVEEAIRAHVDRDVVVEVVGFLPGFAYLGEIDPRLQRPRRTSPRRRVAPGSVGIAGRHTGIYPTASPGGWNLIGRAVDPALFDPTRDPPARFSVGDRVSFEIAEAGDAGAVSGGSGVTQLPPPSTRDGLCVERVTGLATIQDAGRTRWLSRGVPSSGALDPVALAAANLAVGNEATAAGIEIAMGGFRAVARGRLLVSIDGEKARALEDGDPIELAPGERLARYVAVRGAIDVPPVLGGRGTAVSAALGGLAGRPLRPGDVVPVGDDPGTRLPDRALLPIPASTDPLVVRIDLLPLAPPFSEASVAALLEATFVVTPALDRTGMRFGGAVVPRDVEPDRLPMPVLPGVVQVPPSGEPIVLGPDAAVTGGYPILGVLRKTSLWSLYRLRPGARVRFARGGPT